MSKRIWLCYLGTLLLTSAVPAAALAAKPGPVQSSTTTVKKQTTSKKKSKAAPKVSSGQKVPTPDRIKEIQSALIREGALSGEPTGRWDSATIDAMRNFQSAQGLNPTGKIDAPSLQKLGLGSEIAGKGAPVPTPANSQTPPTPANSPALP